MSVGVLEDIVSALGLRAVAYVVYAVVSEDGVKYLVVDNGEKVEKLEKFMDYCIREAFEDPKYGFETLEKPYIIWTYDEYMEKWRNLDGKIVVFVEEDKDLKVSAIDAFASIIDKSLKKPFPPPEDWFKDVFLSTLLMVVKVVDAVGEGGTITRDKLGEVVGRVIYEEQLSILVDLLRERGIEVKG